ncbi:hypothetical protein BJ912DRAFT_436169 [Pholiota molesta]|nr:hypothetical protein BJ912DRAFT_436169 [Pholiota molesta]
MHPALLIDEILRHVFLFCFEDDRPSLVAAAQACKAWKDPALDFIWDRLSSFKPLLHLLPTFSKVDGEYILTAEPSEKDWHRFNAYARRIKHVSNRHELKIHPSVVMSSLSTNTGNSALPNLSTAYISLPKSAVCLMSLNFSPNLVRLEIDLGFKATSYSLNDAFADISSKLANTALNFGISASEVMHQNA